jgi:hypothetical protein
LEIIHTNAEDGQVNFLTLQPPPQEATKDEKAKGAQNKPFDIIWALFTLAVDAMVQKMLSSFVIETIWILTSIFKFHIVPVAALRALHISVTLQTLIVAQAGLRWQTWRKVPAVWAVLALIRAREDSVVIVVTTFESCSPIASFRDGLH